MPLINFTMPQHRMQQQTAHMLEGGVSDNGEV